MHPDYRDILAVFAEHAVEYVIVGGYAVALHGKPRFTKDLDLWIGASAENLGRAHRALEAFGAPRTVIEQLHSASGLDVLWMGAPPLRIDILKGVPGGDFERAYAGRAILSWDGMDVSVVSIEELVRLKRASGRPQDLLDADSLEQLKG